MSPRRFVRSFVVAAATLAATLAAGASAVAQGGDPAGANSAGVNSAGVNSAGVNSVGVAGYWQVGAEKIAILPQGGDGRMVLTYHDLHFVQSAPVTPGVPLQLPLQFTYRPSVGELSDKVPPEVKQDAVSGRDGKAPVEWRMTIVDFTGTDGCDPTLKVDLDLGTISYDPADGPDGKATFKSVNYGQDVVRFELAQAGVRICKPVAVGLFRDPTDTSCPALVPAIQPDGDGHPTLYVPKTWLAPGPATLRLLQVKEVANACVEPTVLETVAVTKNANPAPCDWVRLDNDAADTLPPTAPGAPGFADFWDLGDGNAPYQVHLAAHAPPTGGSGGQFHSAIFGSRDVTTLLYRRLNALSTRLTGLPFNRWVDLDARSPAAARQLLWKQAYDRAEGYHGAVTVANAAGSAAAHTGTLTVNAVLRDGSRLAMDKRVLAFGGGASGPNAVAPGQTRQIAFGPFNLAKDVLRNAQLQELLTALEIVLESEGREQKLTVPMHPEKGFADPVGLLGLAMRQDPTLADESDPAKFEAAVDVALGAEASFGETRQQMQLGKKLLEDDYAKLKTLAAKFRSRAGTADAKLAALDELMRQACLKSSVQFGIPADQPAGPSIGDPKWVQGETVTLDVPASFQRWAFFGKLVNPDGPTWTTSAADLARDAPGQSQCNCSPPPSGPQAPPDRPMDPAARKAALDLLANPNVPGLLNRYRANVDGLKGYMFEQLIVPDAKADLINIAKAVNPQYGDRVIALPGRFYSGSIPRTRNFGRGADRPQQSSDLPVLAFRVDANGRTQVDLVINGQIKSGQASAKGAQEQFLEDPIRINVTGGTFDLTNDERLQMRLGTESEPNGYTVERRSNGLEDMFRYTFASMGMPFHDKMFQLLLPADVVPNIDDNQRLPTGEIPPILEVRRSEGVEMLPDNYAQIAADLPRQMRANQIRSSLTAGQVEDMTAALVRYAARTQPNLLGPDHVCPGPAAEFGERIDPRGIQARNRASGAAALGLAVAQNLASATKELDDLRQEHLVVRYKQTDATMQVNVGMSLNDTVYDLKLERQMNLLQAWYRASFGLGSDDPLPEWLTGKCGH